MCSLFSRSDHRPFVKFGLSERPRLRLRRRKRVGYCGLWDKGLCLASRLRNFATNLGGLRWLLSKEGGCPATEDISSAP